MQNFCMLVSTLIVTVHMESVRTGIYVNENQSDADYKSSLRPLSGENTQKSSSDEVAKWLDFYQMNDGRPEDDTINSAAQNAYIRFPNFSTTNDDDAVRLLLNLYSHLSHRNTESSYDGEKDYIDFPNRNNKRALTMLTRWKPFRIPNSIGSGNGRHVIRSPLIARSDPSNSYSKMQIMGRPFRWG